MTENNQTDTGTTGNVQRSSRNARTNQQGRRNQTTRGKNTIRTNNEKSRLKGAIDELGHYVYFIGSHKQTDNYNVVTEQIYLYILRKMDHGDDIVLVLKNGKDIDFDEIIANLPVPPANANVNVTTAANRRVQKVVDREEKYNANKVQAYSIIYGQCSKSLQNKIKERSNYLTEIYNNPVKLLTTIKELAHSYQPDKYPIMSTLKALTTLINCKRREDENVTDFARRFKSAKDIFISLGGRFVFESFHNKIDSLDIWDHQFEENFIRNSIDDTHNRTLAYLFLSNVDTVKCNTMLEEMDNDYAKPGLTKDYIYPDKLDTAISTLSSYKVGNLISITKKQFAQQKDRNDGKHHSFAQGQKIHGRRDNDGKVRCYGCGAEGVIKPNCPKCNKKAIASNSAVMEDDSTTKSIDHNQSHVAFQVFCASQLDVVSKDWLLLDSGSSTHIFCDDSLLDTVYECNEELKLITNGGVLYTKKKGHVKGLGEVWYQPDAIINVISLGLIEKRYRVIYDSLKGSSFKVVKNNFHFIEFKKHSSELYIIDLKKETPMFSNVQTVEKNKSKFTKNQVDKAELARELYYRIGNPSIQDFKNIVKMKTIGNLPITVKDIENAEYIFGPDVYTLKGKSTRTAPSRVVIGYVRVPKELKAAHELQYALQ